MAAKKRRGPPASRWWTRRNAVLFWALGILWAIGLAAYPPSHAATRLASLLLTGGLAAGLLALLWRWRLLWWALVILYAALALFWVLPGRKSYDRPRLRAETARALRRYDGVRYYRNGENALGIDGSGLVRRGAIEALAFEGFRTLNPLLTRKAASLWWRDLSMQSLETGARGQARRIVQVRSLREADPGILYPGDFAVTEGGAHVLAHLGGSLWIEADPAEGKVVILDTHTSQNPRLGTPASIFRWRHLTVPHSRLR